MLCFGSWTWDEIVVGGGVGMFLHCSHTEHALVYAWITLEQGHRVCRRELETIGGICVGQKQSKTRGKIVCCLLCVCVLSSWSFLFYRTFCTLVLDVEQVK